MTSSALDLTMPTPVLGWGFSDLQMYCGIIGGFVLIALWLPVVYRVFAFTQTLDDAAQSDRVHSMLMNHIISLTALMIAPHLVMYYFGYDNSFELLPAGTLQLWTTVLLAFSYIFLRTGAIFDVEDVEELTLLEKFKRYNKAKNN